MFDRDGDGKISSAEFRAVMGSFVENIQQTDIDKMIREADLDGDGTLSFDEFQSLLLPQQKKKLICGKSVGEKPQGETAALRNAMLKEGDGLIKDFKGKENLKDIFEDNVKNFPSKPLLGTREKIVGENGVVTFGNYTWRTYQQVSDDSRALAAFIYKHDLSPKNENEEGTFRFLALYAKNRDEWVVTDFGCLISGITVVTLYDTLGQESIDFILNQTYMKSIVLSADKIKNIVSLKVAGKIPTLTHLIYFDEAKSEDVEAAKASGLNVFKYEDVLSEGKALGDNSSSWDPVTPDTFYTFSYTSGTTGVPKGVMLTHRNFVVNIGGLDFYPDKYNDEDTCISYLPLAHVFERLMLLTAMAVRM